LPSVFTLSKESFALGKDFAERSTRQSPLGNFFHGKIALPSAFYRGARQNIEKFCRVFVKALGKVFIAVTAPAVNEYFAECHTSALGKLTFYFYFFKTLPSASDMGTRQSFFFYFSQILSLPSAPVLGTRQSFAEIF
jgi:hypothetical protein